VLALVLEVRSDRTNGHPSIALDLLLPWAFAIAGLIAMARRPENGTGRLLLTVCFGWLLSLLSASDDRALYTIGQASGALALAAVVHLVLAYPSGRLQTRIDRVVVTSGWTLAIVANVLDLLFVRRPSDCPTCPTNALFVTDSKTAADAIDTTANVIAALLIGTVVVVVARRYRAATPVARRLMRPIGIAGGVPLLLLTIGFAAGTFSDDVQSVFIVAGLVALIALPFWYVVGVFSSRLARGGVAQLLVDVRETASLRDAERALRRALNDPGVCLAAWVDERRGYVDAQGRAFDVPIDDLERVATLVAAEGGEPVAAIVHDRALLEEPELVEGVAAAARLALQRNRLQAELAARLDELQRERDFMRDVVNVAPAFFLVVDYDGRIIRFNDTMADACGIPDTEDVRGRYWWDVFIAPDDRAEVSTLTAAVSPERHQHRFRAAGGGELVGIWSLKPVSDSEGRPRLVLTGADVSERVRQEDELRRERDFLSIVARSTPTLMCIVDSDGVVTERGVNAAFTSATGITDEHAIGKPFWELVAAPRLHERVRVAFADAVVWGGAERIETPWHAAGGGELIVEWWVTSLEAYRPGHFLVSGNDVTKRKRDEDELRQSRTRLLQAADAERRRLERNLHDGAQQRLVSLSLALRLVEQMVVRDPQTAHEIVDAAMGELSLALQELRELARGLHPAVLTDRGLEPALEAVADRAPLPVEIQVESEERLPTAVEVAIYYVTSEALTNVAKYAGATAASVTVRRLDGQVIVEVADDGKGGADPEGGTGLRGLADRVEALDGRLRVESPPGGGTRIVAAIPLAEVREPVPQDAG
jgi:PAS domain S-box-containing protein